MDAAWTKISIAVAFSEVACKIEVFRTCFLARHSFASDFLVLVFVYITIFANVLLQRSLAGRKHHVVSATKSRAKVPRAHTPILEIGDYSVDLDVAAS